jgi:hypothetical protein
MDTKAHATYMKLMTDLFDEIPGAGMDWDDIIYFPANKTLAKKTVTDVIAYAANHNLPTPTVADLKLIVGF